MTCHGVRHPFPSPCCVLAPGVDFTWPRGGRHTAQCAGEIPCSGLLNPSLFPSPCRVFTGRLSPGVDFAWPQAAARAVTEARAVTDLFNAQDPIEPRIVLFDSELIEFKLEIRLIRRQPLASESERRRCISLAA